MWPDSGGMVRVATKSKWLFSEPEKLRADVLIVDITEHVRMCTGRVRVMALCGPSRGLTKHVLEDVYCLLIQH